MKNEKFCFDKKVGILLLVGIMFIAFAFSSQSLLSQQQSTDSNGVKLTLNPAGHNVNNCGITRIDCQKTFDYDKMVCIGDNTRSWCAYQVPKGMECAQTNPKYMYPIKNSDGKIIKPTYCMKEVRETAVADTNIQGYYCSFALTKVNINPDNTEAINNMQRLSNCKNYLAPVEHSND
jgi:hypothetical protein